MNQTVGGTGESSTTVPVIRPWGPPISQTSGTSTGSTRW